MRLALRRSDDSADTPPYLSQLKLHTPPFSSNTDGAFFYADAERSACLDTLQRLTGNSEQLLLVVGDKGLGKSTLIDKYLERVEEQWFVCRLAAAQGIDLDTLSTRVSECFAPELGRVEPSQLLDALRQHLDVLLGMQLSVLVIDDAHALSDQVLGVVLQLAALQGEGGKMIRVLLFADSTIDERLQSSRFAGIVDPCRIELKPLQEWDSAVYLLHRLQQAGMSGGSPFSPAEMKQLYRQARGIPAQLNRAAHELLLERSRRSGMFLGLSGRSLRYGLAASALIVLVLVMHERINGVLAGGSPPLAAERQAQPLARSGRPTTVPAANSKEACDGGTAGVGCSTAAASPPPHLVGTSAEPKLNPKPEAGVAGTAAQQPVAADAVPPASQKVAKPAAMARGRVEGSDWIAAQPADHFTLQLLATSEQRGVDEFLAAHAALSGPLASFAQQREGKWLNVLIHGSYGSRVQAEAAARELPDNLQPWIREFAGIKPVVQHSAAPLVPAGQKLSVGLKDTAWVWSQDPSHYTIQLSGALDEASIEAEVRGLSLPGEFAAVQTLRNGKPWYALIYGSFSDKAAAQDAVTQLPPGVQKAGPWPRQFSALQDEIAQAGSAH